MRIGIICYPSHGGSGVMATELGKMLAEKGHEVHFISYDMPFRLGGFQHDVYYHEVEANRYALFKYPPYDIALASRTAQVVRQHQLDILHVHYAVPHAMAAVIAKQMVDGQVKVITTLHGTDVTVLGEDPVLRDIIRFSLERCDRVTAVSESLRQQAIEMFDLKIPVKRIYNFVDVRTYYPRDVQELRVHYAKPEEKLLLHISNFRAVKRPMDVIAIFERVQKKLPARLLLVGEGPEWARVHKKVRDLGLMDRVHFLGKQDEVAQLISLADLLLLPSEKESFGLAALEAMACGVPTVGSHTGGLPEVVEHGKTGFLAPVGDVDRMAEYAVELLTNPSLYKTFVENGLARAKEKFCGQQITEQYIELYRELLSKTGK